MSKSYFDVSAGYRDLKKSRFVILPVPYERTTTFIKGAAAGPEAIRSASAHVELFDEETGVEPYLDGIHSADPVEFGRIHGKEALEKIGRTVRRYVDRGKFVIAIGGEHTITAGIVPVYAKKYADLTVLQLDAHADLRASYEGSRYNHACVGRRILESAPLVQVGIRAISVEEAAFISSAREKKIRGRQALAFFPAHEIQKSRNWISKVVNSLSSHVYLTIDLDGLDPSIIPAVGTPEPGGLGWRETLELLKRVISKRTLVGMDMVELCPRRGDVIGDFAAARLLHKILAYSVAKSKHSQ